MLSELGVDIYLHMFEYGRGEQKELAKYCKEVHYYKRNPFVKSFLSTDPFIVKSRSNDRLITNLNKDPFPILFEGLHTTYPVFENLLKGQPVFVRAHNIEHRFYKGLSESESNLFKKRFFKQEAKKLKRYQQVLKKVNGVFTISPFEQAYFFQKFGDHCQYVPAFHEVFKKQHLKNKGTYILYHGNMMVPENVKAALFLIKVYKGSKFTFKIASSHVHKTLVKEIGLHPNISFTHIREQSDLSKLFEEAHINVLPTFQKTGIKLKLLNTLYQSKFVIANDFMIDDTGLETLCERANTKAEFLNKTEMLFNTDFSNDIVNERLQILQQFDPIQGGQKIIDTIFN
jgi:glycosyltransferase involved in cell wall biosynthesis